MNLTDEQIKTAFTEAKLAAQALAETPDKGASNFDTVTLAHGMKNRKLASLAGKCGLYAHTSRWCGCSHVFINFSTGGADRRTKMNEAAMNSLTESGIAASMYYQRD